MGLTQNLGRLSPSIFSDSSLNIGVGAAPLRIFSWIIKLTIFITIK